MSLISLPLEILRSIVGLLSLQDIFAVIEYSRRLEWNILGNENYCKDLVHRLIPDTREERLAKAGVIKYRQALVNTWQTHNYLALGKPCDTLTLPAGSDYLYQDGTICILRGCLVDVYNIHSAQPKLGLDLSASLSKASQIVKLELLHFCANTLTIRVDYGTESRLAIFRVPEKSDASHKLLLLINVPRAGIALVRNDVDHAVVGIYSTTNDGTVWRFAWFSLKDQGATRLYEVGNFRSHEVGVNIVFEVLGGWFWVLTSQITHDPEGTDPISYYGGCRIRLGQPASRAQYWRMWRRQQIEGPIHDLWTTLSLTKDGQGPYVVTETRSEWLRPDTKTRSFYTTTFEPEPFDPGDNDPDGPLAYEDLARNTGHDDFEHVETTVAAAEDSFLTTFHGRRVRHIENSDSARVFRIGQVAYSKFLPLADTFVDVVWDSIANVRPTIHPGSGNRVLRVRLGSRKAGPDYETLPPDARTEFAKAELPIRIPETALEKPYIDNDAPIFKHCPVAMYPNADSSAKHVRRLEQAGFPNNGDYRFSIDDRTVVIGTKRRRRNRLRLGRRLVIINFDPLAKWREARKNARQYFISQKSCDAQDDPAMDSSQKTEVGKSGSLSSDPKLDPGVDPDEYLSTDDEAQSSGEEKGRRSTMTMAIREKSPTPELKRQVSPKEDSGSSWSLSPHEDVPSDGDSFVRVVSPMAVVSSATAAHATAATTAGPASMDLLAAAASPATRKRGRSDSTSSSSGASAILKAPREDFSGATGGYVYASDDEVMSVAAGKRPAIIPPEPKRLRVGASGDPWHAPAAAAKSAIASSSKAVAAAAAANSAVSAPMSAAGGGSAMVEEGEEGDVEEVDDEKGDDNDEDSGSDDIASNASMPSATPPLQQWHERPHQPTKGGPSLARDAFPSIDVAASVEANLWHATALEFERGLQERQQEYEQTVQPRPPAKNGEGDNDDDMPEGVMMMTEEEEDAIDMATLLGL